MSVCVCVNVRFVQADAVRVNELTRRAGRGQAFFWAGSQAEEGWFMADFGEVCHVICVPPPDPLLLHWTLPILLHCMHLHLLHCILADTTPHHTTPHHHT